MLFKGKRQTGRADRLRARGGGDKSPPPLPPQQRLTHRARELKKLSNRDHKIYKSRANMDDDELKYKNK